MNSYPGDDWNNTHKYTGIANNIPCIENTSFSNSCYQINENLGYSTSKQEYDVIFRTFDETCSHCGKLQKLHHKFGKDTRCFRMSLQGGYDWQYYNWFEANYNRCFYADFENGIMYIHMNYTETLDTANWKNFKFHCNELFGITLERLQHFRTQHKKRVCKRDNGEKYNRTYRLKKKGILVNPY